MVYMHHSFLIHLSADGHLGCFHVLAMINSAAMNIGVHVSLSDLVSSNHHILINPGFYVQGNERLLFLTKIMPLCSSLQVYKNISPGDRYTPSPPPDQGWYY